jgi:hypothetical protein
MSERITKRQVRDDFAYMRRLMRMADRMMRENADCTEGGEFEQLACELSGVACTLTAYLEQQREMSAS